MLPENLSDILLLIENGGLSAQNAEALIKRAGYADHGDVKIDTDRRRRVGFDEVIYGRGKTALQIENIARIYIEKGLNFVCTGLDEQKTAFLETHMPMCVFVKDAGIMKHIATPADAKNGSVAIITAGTSDMRCAREAQEMLEISGVCTSLYADIGVAGIHRFFGCREEIEKADVIIVIAGMEGALPSIAGGIFAQPVIAVPTSTGYGTALNGFTALFAMLTSCAAGITVVNIDNGFGAAMAAIRILNLKNGNTDK